jgi:hypothetical protein
MKRRFKSYADCEAAYDAAQSEATVSAQFINAMMNGETCGVSRRGPYTVRVYRPAAAHGGIVAVTFRAEGQADHTAAYYLDAWAADRRLHVHDLSNAEGVAVNELRYWAVEYRNRCVAAPLPPPARPPNASDSYADSAPVSGRSGGKHAHWAR